MRGESLGRRVQGYIVAIGASAGISQGAMAATGSEYAAWMMFFGWLGTLFFLKEGALDA